MSAPLVLGIETSCDETGAGLVRGHELLADLGVLGFLVVEKEAANELTIGSDCRCRCRRPVYSIRYLTILIRMLPV